MTYNVAPSLTDGPPTVSLVQSGVSVATLPAIDLQLRSAVRATRVRAAGGPAAGTDEERRRRRGRGHSVKRTRRGYRRRSAIPIDDRIRTRRHVAATALRDVRRPERSLAAMPDYGRGRVPPLGDLRVWPLRSPDRARREPAIRRSGLRRRLRTSLAFGCATAASALLAHPLPATLSAIAVRVLARPRPPDDPHPPPSTASPSTGR